MLIYILKASCCLAILLGFYKLIIEKEKMHQIKRIFLLGTFILSSLIPIITFTTYIQALPSDPVITNVTWDNTILIERGVQWLPIILWSIYGIGALFFGFRLLKNLNALRIQIKNNEKQYGKNETFVLLEKPTIPHTFLHYIFVNKELFETHEIPDSVLLHEKVHVHQKHSWDVLFIELICWLCWYNPLVYLLKHEIRLNHEYLADEAVLDNGFPTSSYQQTLLDFGGASPIMPLTHSFYYKPIKKRFLQMKKQSSKTSIWVRSLLLIPLIAALSYGFSNKVTAHKDPKGATPEMIEKYNTTAKAYNMAGEDVVVKKEDVWALKQIYYQMTKAQRKEAEPFPDFPAPPMPLPTIETVVPSDVHPHTPIDWNDISVENSTFYIDKEEVPIEKIKGLGDPQSAIINRTNPDKITYKIYFSSSQMKGC